MKEYIVTKEILNIRSKPSDESDDTYVGKLMKGDRVWLEDDDIIGVVPKGGESNIWKIKSGSVDVVAKDGVALDFQNYIDERFDAKDLKEVIDYNLLLNIPQEIKQGYGKNSVIGILDQPISTNINFENLIRPGGIITKNSPTNHGNFIAGIIGSNASSKINGICPMATILDLTYNDINGNLITDDGHYDNLINCIKSFDKQVVINISRFLDDSLKFVIEKFKNLTNIIFVCSAGTDTELLNIDNSFLADYPNAISVGTASLEFLNSNISKIDKRLNIILPILSYSSFNSDGITFSKISDLSSSWATAVISSIIALFYSNNKLTANATKSDIISQIQNFSKNFDSYNLLNPLKF